MGKSNAPAVPGISIKIDNAPEGVPAGTPVEVGHLDDVGGLGGFSRAVEKSKPLNHKAYSQSASPGTLEYEDITLTVKYDPEGAEGANIAKAAGLNGTPVQITAELDNAGGANGTTQSAICYIQDFKPQYPKDGQLVASITLVLDGEYTDTGAA